METWNRSVGMQVPCGGLFSENFDFFINFQKQCRTQWLPIYKVGMEHADGSSRINVFCWSIFKNNSRLNECQFLRVGMLACSWVHFYMFTHFLKSLVIGVIIFLGACFQTWYNFLLIHLLERLDCFFGWIFFFWWSIFQHIFFFCWISWLQCVFLYIIWFLILFYCLVHRKLFEYILSKLVIKGSHTDICVYHYHWIITTKHVIF